MTITRSGWAWLIAIAALLVYDGLALLCGWGTLSASASEYAHQYPILPFAAGVVAGHLFWNKWKE